MFFRDSDGIKLKADVILSVNDVILIIPRNSFRPDKIIFSVGRFNFQKHRRSGLRFSQKIAVSVVGAVKFNLVAEIVISCVLKRVLDKSVF